MVATRARKKKLKNDPPGFWGPRKSFGEEGTEQSKRARGPKKSRARKRIKKMP